jgi:hypothetical protein
MSALNELRELDAYLEGSEDIDNNGGPNDAMRVRQVLAQAIPDVAELIDSHARLLRLCESCRLPKTADDMMPMIEARRIAARVQGGQS